MFLTQYQVYRYRWMLLWINLVVNGWDENSAMTPLALTTRSYIRHMASNGSTLSHRQSVTP